MAKASAISPEMKALSSYMTRALGRRLPAKVAEKAKHHILDTLAAIISGSRLVPGEKAISFVRSQGGKKEALVLGTRYMTTAINAAMTNAIMAHADETDDSHFRANMHPGSIMVPAALAIAERNGLSGDAFLKAVALGYDVGCRCNMALDATNLRRLEFDSHSFGGSFGAGAAAGALLGLNAEQMRFVLSYAAQQTSGMRTWRRDPEHVEKAFVFSGMSARNGVTAALMIEDGFTGVDDVFSGDPNYLDIYVDRPKRKELSAELGKRYEVIYTNIKKWSVGSPIQSPLDGVQAIMREHGVGAEDLDSMLIHLPTERVKTVDNRDMPDINLQHLAAVMLLDGTVSFESSHKYERMNDPKTKALRGRISLAGSDMLSRARPGRQAIVEMVCKDGRKLKKRIRAVRGTADNPMTRHEVEDKAVDLMAPVLGSARTRKLVNAIWSLEKRRNVCTLRKIMTA
ncbi:MAG: MmgE/PrpD family protein [Rhodospirillaceae bacterium]|nr:MmgE/PrpD family protein [Rhodospirillaceae bacterium]